MDIVLHWLWIAAKAVFFALPGTVAFLIAAASLAVLYMEELQRKLKDQRLIRWIAATTLLLMGIGAFTSDRLQKNEERNERERAITETSKEVAAETSKQVTTAVTGQYAQMIADQKSEITELKNKLVSQSRVLSVIKGSNIVTGKNPIKVEVTNERLGMGSQETEAEKKKKAEVRTRLGLLINEARDIMGRCLQPAPNFSCENEATRWNLQAGKYIQENMEPSYVSRFSSAAGPGMSWSGADEKTNRILNFLNSHAGALEQFIKELLS